MRITSDFELTETDYALINNTIDDFLLLYRKSHISNFYTTVFFQEAKRKLNLNFAFGKCTRCQIKKLEGTNE